MSTPITTREDLTRIQWFAMSAYKNEKKAEEMLKGKDGLEYFIPKHYAVRVYHGVKSKRLVPVIPNLVFVHASRKQITDFKKKYNFLQFMMWEKSTGLKYIVVPDKQMESFIKIASQYEENTIYYKPEEIDIPIELTIALNDLTCPCFPLRPGEIFCFQGYRMFCPCLHVG